MGVIGPPFGAPKVPSAHDGLKFIPKTAMNMDGAGAEITETEGGGGGAAMTGGGSETRIEARRWSLPELSLLQAVVEVRDVKIGGSEHRF